ncbi:hypothetical protein LINPERHAP1_LOCUS13042 [Linum perenne]
MARRRLERNWEVEEGGKGLRQRRWEVTRIHLNYNNLYTTLGTNINTPARKDKDTPTSFHSPSDPKSDTCEPSDLYVLIKQT